MPVQTLISVYENGVTFTNDNGANLGLTSGIDDVQFTITGSPSSLLINDTDGILQNDNSTADGFSAEFGSDDQELADGTNVFVEGTIEVTIDGDPSGTVYTVIVFDTDDGTTNTDGTYFVILPYQDLSALGSPPLIPQQEGLQFPVGTSFTAIDFSFDTTPEVIYPVCYTRGVEISCKDSNIPVEMLCPGDLVHTANHGFQPIRWIGSRKLDVIDLAANPKLRPMRIKAGAFGDNIPETDLSVSPQHRMLIRGKIVQRMFGVDEVLVPAVKLLDHGLAGVERDDTCAEVEYFHILFDEHEIIFANGAPCESLYTGAQAIKSLSPAARKEIKTLFPEICEDGYSPTPARMIVQKNAHVAQLLTRHQKNQKPLLA